MGNSKTRSTSRKHRTRRRAAKVKVREQQRLRDQAEQLPVLALKMLSRRLRVQARSS